MKVLNISLMAGNNGFTKSFKSKGSEYRELKPSTNRHFNTQAIEMCKSMTPDLVFIQIQTPNIIHESTVKEFKRLGAFVINFTGDVRSPIPQWYYDIGKHIDLTLFSNMTDVLKLREDGLSAEYLEIGYDPEIYKPKGTIIKTPEVVFFGNNYDDRFPLSGYRKDMVNFLKSTYGSNFGLYGNGWSNANGSFNHSQEIEARAYRGCKIAVNLSHFDYERYNSDRILRIMGSGAMCLTKTYKGIKQDYSIGVNLAAWDNFDELKDNIDFYLENNDERIEVAKKGNDLVKDTFTFDSMIDNLLKFVV